MKMQFRNKFLLFVSIKQKLENFSAYLLDLVQITFRSFLMYLTEA